MNKLNADTTPVSSEHKIGMKNNSQLFARRRLTTLDSACIVLGMMKQTIPAHIHRHSDSCLTFCGLNRAPKRTHLEGCKGYPCTCTTFVDCEECKASKERKRQSQAEAAKRMLQTRREREAAIPADFEIYD